MGWLEDVVSSLQTGGAPFAPAPANPFPDVPKVAETDPAKIWADIEAKQAAENEASARRNAAGLTRNFGGGQTAPYAPFGIPDVNSAGVQLAMDQAPAGTGFPGAMPAGAPDGSAFGTVPNLAQFGATTVGAPAAAPGAPGAPASPPVPPSAELAAKITRAQDMAAAPLVGTPTDVSSQSRAPGPAGPPVPLVPPQVAQQAVEPSFMDRLKGFAPALMGAGAALRGDMSVTQNILKDREAKALQAQQGNATARLLASRGAKPAEVQAAMLGGPEAVKALLGEYLGKDKWKVVQTGQDAQGRKTFMQQNEMDGTLRPLPGQSGPAHDPAAEAAAAGKTGDEFLSAIPDGQDRQLVRQLINYDLDPGKLSAKNGNRERLIALASQADPDYRPSLYAPRAASIKEFTSGGPNSPASIITNGNTAIQHLGRMSELAEKLGGTNKAWILNGLVNWANVKAEELKNNPDLAAYKSAEDRFVEEATKFYRGVGGNKSDIDRALSILTPGQSPEARRAAILEQAELMQSKINALQGKYQNGVGPAGWKKMMSEAGSEFPIVQKHSAEELEKIRKRAAGETVAPTAGAPVKPGAYVWDPKTGALVPK